MLAGHFMVRTHTLARDSSAPVVGCASRLRANLLWSAFTEIVVLAQILPIDTSGSVFIYDDGLIAGLKQLGNSIIHPQPVVKVSVDNLGVNTVPLALGIFESEEFTASGLIIELGPAIIEESALPRIFQRTELIAEAPVTLVQTLRTPGSLVLRH